MIDWLHPENLECVEVASGRVVEFVPSATWWPGFDGYVAHVVDEVLLFLPETGMEKGGTFQIRNKAPSISPTLAAELLALPDGELRARLTAMVPETDEERALRRVAELYTMAGQFGPTYLHILTIAKTLVNEGLIRKEEGR